MTFPRVLPRALLALSLAVAPVAATAATVDGARVAAPVEGEQLGGHPFAWAMAALIAVVAGVLVFSDDDEDPVSP